MTALKCLTILLSVAYSTGKDRKEELVLDYDTAANLAELPLHCINTEYPNKLSQLLKNESDLLPPSVLHPIFYGCYDWHSSVHGHWLLAKVGNLFPQGEIVNNITDLLREQITPDKIETEVEYFEEERTFERTYGWAWLLKLQEEMLKSENEEILKLARIQEPLAVYIADLYKGFLPRLVYPIRTGEHPNTGFGLAFALDYARHVGDSELVNLIIHNSTAFYRSDSSCPLVYEPSGYDFLSPCLQEADLMTRVIEDPEEFSVWLSAFLPQLFDEEFVLEPGKVVDRTDGKLVHLDGLNFSRAWALYSIAIKLPEVLGARAVEMADNHILTSIDYVVGSDYVGSHWLASFLLFALEKRGEAVQIVNKTANK